MPDLSNCMQHTIRVADSWVEPEEKDGIFSVESGQIPAATRGTENMLKQRLLALISSAFLLAMPLQAADISPGVKSLLKKLGLSEQNISDAPIDGLYELQAGTQLYYLSKDGTYLISGSIMNMTTRENLTENRLKSIRAGVIGSVGSDQLISYKARDEKHKITVFTDIDCGYCRKLHAEMQQYNDLGITVNYLFYPRTGPGSASFKSAVSVWCNANRNDAMTRAKRGEQLKEVNCENPVTKHFMLGNEMGINGTPAIVTARGDLMPGYMPPHALKSQLDKAAGL